MSQWRHLAHVLISVGSLLLSACNTTPTQPMQSLAGTRWALHAIQSMDDAQGRTRIADPLKFTVVFGVDGSASFKLDCNRGMAKYTSEPVDAHTGQLSFGPVAATRALCPPPHLDERIARDIGFVRSYLLKDGKLFMSLMADGGIYEWHPSAE